LAEQLKISEIGKEQILEIARLTNLQRIMQDVRNISIVRVSGTPENEQVRRYIINSFSNTKFQVETDQFEDETPQGRKQFTNIIATFNPKAKKTLLLSAHFDSKYFSGTNNFKAAIDSAVPCALLLDIARMLNDKLTDEVEYGIQLVFFDGEEAFVRWSSTDSTYGSRHLAAKWAAQESPASTDPVKIPMNQNIGLFVLLDLLGSDQTHIQDFFQSTSSFYNLLAQIERKLKENEAIPINYTIFNGNKWYSSRVEDDHIPFLRRGVPILHLIPGSFPGVWHKFSDTVENLHQPTVSSWASIFRVFVAQILNLQF